MEHTSQPRKGGTSLIQFPRPAGTGGWFTPSKVYRAKSLWSAPKGARQDEVLDLAHHHDLRWNWFDPSFICASFAARFPSTAAPPSDVPIQIPRLFEASTPPTPSSNVATKATLPSIPSLTCSNDWNLPAVPGAVVPASAIVVARPPLPRKMPLELEPPVNLATKATSARSLSLSAPTNASCSL